MEYVISLIKTIFSKSNIGFVVFVFVNIAPICFLFAYKSIWYAIYALFSLFVVYTFVVMTIGEFVARLMLKANTRVQLDERTPLSVMFSNAYRVAKRKNPIISNNIRLYVFDGVAIDGYAFGRNTLCISSAALNLPEQDLTTLLLMKFAQFSHHDSEILAILTAGNLWYIAIAVISKWYIYFFGLIAWLMLSFTKHSFGGFVLGRVFRGLAEATEKIILMLVKVILMLGVGSYKNNVLINDLFVCDCGYRNELIRFLQDFEPEQVIQETLFGTINSMKPDKHIRLERVRNYTLRMASLDGFRIIRR
ncbi:MAG: hypothetical protein WAT94_02640 [Enterococcus aquimarinus]